MKVVAESFDGIIGFLLSCSSLFLIMPHSVSPEDPSAPDQDAMIADAETNGEIQSTSQSIAGEAETSNGDSQNNNAVDQDMEIENAGAEGDDVFQIKPDAKYDIKLEDLFADVESDNEFPSSIGHDIKVEDSPEAPLSPM